MSTVVLLQARLGSVRLPGKVLLPLGPLPLVEWPIARLSTLGPIVVCIPSTPANDPLAETLPGPIIRGPEDDVLARFLLALEAFPATEIVVRATADNPLALPELAEAALQTLDDCGADYCSIEGSALGTTVEVLTAEALRRIGDLATSSEEREHPTLGILRRPALHIAYYQAPPEYAAPHLRLTIDTRDDYLYAEALVRELRDPVASDWQAIRAATARIAPDNAPPEHMQQHFAEVQHLKAQAWQTT